MDCKINDFINFLNKVETLQNKLISVVNSQFDKWTNSFKKVDVLILRMNTLTADNDALKSRVSVMEENINSVQKHNTDFNKVIKNNFIN